MIPMDIEDRMMIAGRLKEIRTDNELTLKDMGQIMQVSEATVSRYESGEVGNIPLQRIRLLAKHFGLNAAWILGMSDKKFLYGKE